MMGWTFIALLVSGGIERHRWNIKEEMATPLHNKLYCNRTQRTKFRTRVKLPEG